MIKREFSRFPRINQSICIAPSLCAKAKGYIGEQRELVSAPAGASSLVGVKHYAIILGLEMKLPLW